MEKNRELVAYIPVIHQGYIELFKRHASEIDTLWVLGFKLIGELMEHREIRAVEPRQIGVMAASLGIFSRVDILEEELIPKLEGKLLLMPDEQISRRFSERYLGNGDVVFESVFLRWDEANVTPSQEVIPERESCDPFDRKMMRLIEKEAIKSSDWWRRIGAVIVRGEQVLLAAHNQHEPSEQTPYVVGDPRDVVEAGTHNLLYSSIHAEQLLVAEAAGRGISLSGTDLYINVFPCPMCIKLIALAGIKKCFFMSGAAWLNSEEVMKSFGIETIRVID